MDEIDKKIVLIELKIDGWGISKDEQKWLVNRLKDYKEENKRLNGLFNLQSTRMDKAIKLWRESTGKHDTIPDLGDLLEWLMGIIKQETGTLTPNLNRYLSKREIEQRTKDACFEAGWELVEGIFSAYFFYKERDDVKEQFKQAIYSAEVKPL